MKPTIHFIGCFSPTKFHDLGVFCDRFETVSDKDFIITFGDYQKLIKDCDLVVAMTSGESIEFGLRIAEIAFVYGKPVLLVPYRYPEFKKPLLMSDSRSNYMYFSFNLEDARGVLAAVMAACEKFNIYKNPQKLPCLNDLKIDSRIFAPDGGRHGGEFQDVLASGSPVQHGYEGTR